MYYLSDVQIEIIKKEVLQHNLHIAHLADDMVDHICCDVEEEIWEGATFEEAYNKIFEKIGDNGLHEIQNETLYLIDKNYRIMKKSMKIIGMISMSMVAFGSMFKIQHWPGASILLVLGFFLLACVFFPVAISAAWKESKLKGRLFMNIAGMIGGICLMFGILFKIQHFPGASILLIFGYNIIALLFLPAFVISKYNDKDDQSSKLIYVIGALALILVLEGSLFKIQHYPGATPLLFLGTIMLSLFCLPMIYFKIYKNSNHVKNSFIMLCVGIMMFNILSLLLAMNISKNVITDFVRPGEELAISSRQLHLKNQSLFKQILADSLFTETKQRDEIVEINSKCETLYKFIRDIKIKLVKMSGSSNISEINAEYISPKNIVMKDNVDFAPSLMINGGLGLELKTKFEDLRKVMLTNLVGNDVSKNIIEKVLDTSNPNVEDEKWETYCFQNTILICSFGRLSYLQRNIEIARAEALDFYRMKLHTKLHVT